jgi:NADH-quinone oxidoreductase subunit L
MRRMGGLKKDLPITYWTFIAGALAIAGVPLLSGFFSKDEILWRTFSGGHTVLWVIGIATALLTATYMFRLVIMTFHGERAAATVGTHGAAPDDRGHGHAQAPAHEAHSPGHLHDAPPAMAIPLVVLAIGSVFAGYVGFPHVLGGANRIESFLEPSFHPARYVSAATLTGAGSGFESRQGLAGVAGQAGGAAAVQPGETAAQPPTHEPAEHAGAMAGAADHEPGGDDSRTEFALMAVSSIIALAGIGLAAYFFLGGGRRADAVARALPGTYRTLLNKYWVDELYDAAIVQPIERTSERLLWRTVDAGLIDGVVNGAGAIVRGGAAVLRLAQTGSVRAYAASLFIGVLLVLAYYLGR